MRTLAVRGLADDKRSSRFFFSLKRRDLNLVHPVALVKALFLAIFSTGSKEPHLCLCMES